MAVSGSGVSGGIEISFDVDFERWQRDLRYKYKFFMRDKFRKRMEDLKDKIVEAAIAVAPFCTGDLQDSIEAQAIQYNIDEGVYNYSIGPQVSYARFVEYGRNPGPAPWERIAEWVMHKFNSEDKALIAHVVKKMFTVGFNNNLAPYHMMEKLATEFNQGKIQDFINEVGLDAKEVFEATAGLV